MYTISVTFVAPYIRHPSARYSVMPHPYTSPKTLKRVKIKRRLQDAQAQPSRGIISTCRRNIPGRLAAASSCSASILSFDRLGFHPRAHVLSYAQAAPRRAQGPLLCGTYHKDGLHHCSYP